MHNSRLKVLKAYPNETNIFIFTFSEPVRFYWREALSLACLELRMQLMLWKLLMNWIVVGKSPAIWGKRCPSQHTRKYEHLNSLFQHWSNLPEALEADQLCNFSIKSMFPPAESTCFRTTASFLSSKHCWARCPRMLTACLLCSTFSIRGLVPQRFSYNWLFFTNVDF